VLSVSSGTAGRIAVLTNPDHALTNALGQRPRDPGRAPNIDLLDTLCRFDGKPLNVEAGTP
jgi:hypothetical protein